MPEYIPSTELFDSEQSLIFAIDLQEKLLAAIPESKRLVNNASKLLQAAQLFQVPVQSTEQYPDGLGKTVTELTDMIQEPVSKLRFSSVESLQLCGAGERDDGRFRAVLVGIESHVCVLQTAFDLQALGYEVILPVDAIGSRNAVDYETALRRLENGGMILTTVESILFEWCRTAEHPHFKTVRRIVTDRA